LVRLAPPLGSLQSRNRLTAMRPFDGCVISITQLDTAFVSFPQRAAGKVTPS
jgi:hypothetical protein